MSGSEALTFRAFIFDTETTNLLSSRLIPLKRQPFVTEVYGAYVDLDAPIPSDAEDIPVLWELDTLINPRVPISAEITKITGIDDAMVKDAPVFTTFAPLLRLAIEEADHIIAHNASFDGEMIDIEFARDSDIPLRWPPIICTVEATIHLLGHRMTLQGLHEHLFGERFKEAHRARNDTRALIRCAVELRKRGEL